MFFQQSLYIIMYLLTNVSKHCLNPYCSYYPFIIEILNNLLQHESARGSMGY